MKYTEAEVMQAVEEYGFITVESISGDLEKIMQDNDLLAEGRVGGFVKVRKRKDKTCILNDNRFTEFDGRTLRDSKFDALHDIIKGYMRVRIGTRVVAGYLPEYKRLSSAEMEREVRKLLDVRREPGKDPDPSTMLQLERVPTDELLKQFCFERGLTYRLLDEIDCYLFEVAKFWSP